MFPGIADPSTIISILHNMYVFLNLLTKAVCHLNINDTTFYYSHITFLSLIVDPIIEMHPQWYMKQ